ncbi:MAG: hypothetical protein K2M36_02600, partial [Clostridia bacterium]|nr:hypothetical protein [Clostridia bacterium]
MFNDEYTPQNNYIDDVAYNGYSRPREDEAQYGAKPGPLFPKKDGKANIVVIGVGGGGCNAVNNMIRAKISSANFAVMNTDKQALNMSLVRPECKIQLGHD